MRDQEHSVDRGGGVHVQRASGFRIPEGALRIDLNTGELLGGPIVPDVRADMFHHWLTIAADASDTAERARREAVGADLADGEAFGRAVEHEFRASMVAIAAAAFGIDAFYASVLHHVPDARVRSSSRDASIFETLKGAFSISGKNQEIIREPLRTLFRLRDGATHPRASWVQPVTHPAFNVGMEPRFVEYRVENAISGQLFARR